MARGILNFIHSYSTSFTVEEIQNLLGHSYESYIMSHINDSEYSEISICT